MVLMIGEHTPYVICKLELKLAYSSRLAESAPLGFVCWISVFARSRPLLIWNIASHGALTGGRLFVSDIELLESLPGTRPPSLSVVELIHCTLPVHTFSPRAVARIGPDEVLGTCKTWRGFKQLALPFKLQVGTQPGLSGANI
eukprot:6175215-Pleurochrysis_carterae.AAC.3